MQLERQSGSSLLLGDDDEILSNGMEFLRLIVTLTILLILPNNTIPEIIEIVTQWVTMNGSHCPDRVAGVVS